MGDPELIKINATDGKPRWDDTLLNHRFPVIEERPPLSAGARALEAKENMRRHRTFSTDYSGRGRWKTKQDQQQT